MPNGEIYLMLKVRESIRGYRAYKAIVDNRISLDQALYIIGPVTNLYCCQLDIAYLRKE